MLTLGSLFDGSGGFPLGATLAGITPCVWFVLAGIAWENENDEEKK